MPVSTNYAKAVGMSRIVMLQLFGMNWFRENIRVQKTATHKFKILCANDQSEFHDRLLSLAHKLFALRNCDGFSDLLIRSYNDLDATSFELQVAHLFCSRGFNVVFNHRPNHKGKVHDLTISRMGDRLFIEAKSRVGDGQFGTKKMSNALKKAADQLPESGPGAIAIKVPGQWGEQAESKDQKYEKVTQDIFRNCTRVNYILLFWETYVTEPNLGVRKYILKFKWFESLLPKKNSTIHREQLVTSELNVEFRPSFWPSDFEWK